MSLETYKQRYQTLQAELSQRFLTDPDSVESLVLDRALAVDQLLQDIWTDLALDKQLCLVAVGGYGRSELHLHSDIDLLILIPAHTHETYQADIAKFLTLLWDIGLDVGHASRDLEDCAAEIQDLSVVTNLLESRRLIGDEVLFQRMQSVVDSSHWSSQLFFVEKQKEQAQRHERLGKTAYSLEPNVKEAPGALRDIQTIAWIAKFHFGVEHLSELVQSHYLSQAEFEILQAAQQFLWKVRYALHVVSGRKEERLAFQYQKELAQMLNYQSGDTLAVELLMKDYYQTVTKVSRLADILLQLLEDRIVNTQDINQRFEISYGYIRATHDQVFTQHHAAFIEVFLLLSKHDYVRGIGASTLRQMQANIDLIDENYHKDLGVNRLFIELLQQKQGINQALKLMNRYGVLERYIPAFGKISGLMQYDLFHEFTVDQHTLFVIRNLRRFFVPAFYHEFDLCSEIAQSLSNPEVLLLAGLFHDIAKGRGGDHATLGAKDAEVFCQHHQLKSSDIQLVSNLVRHHLLMSQVSQKADIDDPEVIKSFAAKVQSVQFLELLYLLTVADIRATKLDLWNDWKDSLLKRLFYQTKTYLEQGGEQLPSTDELVSTSLQSALESAIAHGYDPALVMRIFDTLPKDYFLRYHSDEILRHLYLLDKYQDQATLVDAQLSEHNVVDIFVVCDDTQGLFFKLVNTLERLDLEVVGAKILTTKDNRAYNTLSVLPNPSVPLAEINQEIGQALATEHIQFNQASDKYLHRFFDRQTKIEFALNAKWNLTQLEVTAVDKKGVLSAIAYVFYELNISLINARIATIGERVEDVFFICDENHNPLDKQTKQQLKNLLEERL